MDSYKGVIFDLDGTLLDTLDDIGAAVNRMLRAQGLPEHEMDAYRFFVGDGWRMLVTRALPESCRTPERVADAMGRSKAFYEQGWNVHTRPYPGIVNLLNGLRERGLEMAICTNKPHRFALDYVGAYLGEWTFAEVIGQDERFPPKPDPAGALAIARSMQIEPAEVAFLGDSGVDVRTALAAGMRAFGAAWGFRGAPELRENGCPVILDHPVELLQFMS